MKRREFIAGTRVELYRQRATECEALAERANDADRKARLRDAAQQWLDLAERVEQLDATKDTAEPPPVIVAGSVTHSVRCQQVVVEQVI